MNEEYSLEDVVKRLDIIIALLNDIYMFVVEEQSDVVNKLDQPVYPGVARPSNVKFG